MKQNAAIHEIAKYWNIPVIALCDDGQNRSQSILNVFNFAVKYYWFCNTNRLK